MIPLVECYHPPVPVLVRRADNPVVAMNLKVSPLAEPPTITGLSINRKGTSDLRNLVKIHLVSTQGNRIKYPLVQRLKMCYIATSR